MTTVLSCLLSCLIALPGQCQDAGLEEHIGTGRFRGNLWEERSMQLSWERMDGIKSQSVPNTVEEGRRNSRIRPLDIFEQKELLFASPAFEVILLQHLTFGKFRAGPGGGDLVVQPSGVFQTRGDIISLGGTPTPAIFEITTNRLQWLEVLLPGSVHLGASGEGYLSARPFTDFGHGRFILELKPRPHKNYLQVGGELQLISCCEPKAGDFSGSMQIIFRPLTNPFHPDFPIR